MAIDEEEEDLQSSNFGGNVESGVAGVQESSDGILDFSTLRRDGTGGGSRGVGKSIGV